MLITPVEYILNSLIILAGLILEDLIIVLITPAGFIASFSSIILMEALVTESIAKDIKKPIKNKKTCNIPGPATAQFVKGINIY